jgi:hypothetical protein
VIEIYGTYSATTPNLLANTDLQSAPGDGVLVAQLTCTQTDWSFSLSAGEETPVRNQKIPFKATANINQNDDPSTTIAVLAGQQLVLASVVGTAGAGAYLARYYSEDEL